MCLCMSEGLQEVILYTQPDDKKKNRGFCFLEYEDHKSAAQARRRLMSGKVKVWGNPVTVEWADPVAEPDPEVMAKVSKGGILLLHSLYAAGNTSVFVHTSVLLLFYTIVKLTSTVIDVQVFYRIVLLFMSCLCVSLGKGSVCA